MVNMFVGLCFCVSVYDLTHVFMGLIFWDWEIGTHVFFFFFDKVYLVFPWRRKERKRMKKKKKMSLEWVCEEERKKEEEKGVLDVTFL